MQDQKLAFARGCEGKLKHPSKEAALMHLDNLRRHGTRGKVRLNVYLCKFGNHWHVGRRRRQRKERVQV